jgi:AraC family transcriptional regulator
MSLKLLPGCFYGEILKRFEVSGFAFSESTYPPHAKISSHSHSHSYLCILLRGGYRESYDRGMRECRPSTVVFHPAGEVHADQFLDSGGHIFRFEIRQNWLDQARDYTVGLREPFECSGGAISWLGVRLYREFHETDCRSPLVIEGLALEIIGEAARQVVERQECRAPRWLTRAKEALHECLPEDLTVARIADLAQVHPVHLARVFRQFYGCSVGEYIRKLRIDFASRELSSTEMPLAEIAMAAGFSDQSHFSKSFKRFTGMTPSQYRTAIRPARSIH